MASNKHAISWMDMTNTVFNRMAKDSMIHRFTSRRKVRRRTKALNKALGKLPSLVDYTYSQYVKTKTSILRDLSNDSETDNSDTFSDEEYHSLYKSDFLRCEYLNNASTERTCSTLESGFVVNNDKYQMAVVKDKEYSTVNRGKSNDRNSGLTNLGWQNLRRDPYESDDLMRVTQIRKPNCLNGFSCVGKTTGKSIITNDPTELCKRISKAAVSQLKDQSLYVPNNVNPKPELEVNTEIIHHSSEASTSDPEYEWPRGTPTNVHTGEPLARGAKRNLHGILENLKPLHNSKESSSRASLDTSFLQLSNVNPLGRSTPVHEITYRKAYEVYTASVCIQNQPKDSGIDEDSEEESYKDGTKRQCNVKRIERSPLKKHDDPPTDSFSEAITKYSQNAGNTRDVFCLQQENETQKHKIHPKVMCTEIVSKKYKIISEEPRDATFSAFDAADTYENSLLNKSREVVGEGESRARNPDINDDNGERLDISDADKAAEDSVSPLTMKRLGQLRRLNLLVSGNSSSSEDDEPLGQINFSRESVGNSKYIASLSDGTDSCSERPNSKSIVKARDVVHVKSKNSKYALDKDSLLRTPMEPRPDQPIKIEGFVKPTRQKFTVPDEDVDHTHIDTHQRTDTSTNGHQKTADHGSNVGAVDQNSNRANQSCSKSMIGNRPSNLQELIDEEELAQMETAPSFLFKDIDEDDIFIVDIPKAVLETELRGEKIRLTEKKLKLGRHKYEVVFKDLENVSCVFATGESHKPYETVNLKPTGIVIVGRQKSPRGQFSEENERCTSDLSASPDYPLEEKRTVGKSTVKRNRGQGTRG